MGFSSQNKGNRKPSTILINHGLLSALAWTTKEFHMVRSALAAAPGFEMDSFFYLVSHGGVVPREALVDRQWVPEAQETQAVGFPGTEILAKPGKSKT